MTKWYYRYKAKNNFDRDNLVSNLPGANHFIVSKQVQSENCDKPVRLFGAFPSPVEFIREYLSESVEDRTHYECIPGEKGQKIYFDLDFPANFASYPEIVNHVILLKDLIVYHCQQYDARVQEEHIMIFRSAKRSDFEGQKASPGEKISFHLVLSGFYVLSNEHNRAICSQIAGDMPPEVQPHIDMLYSSFQQFRLLASHKLGKDNVKRLEPNLSTWTSKTPKNFRVNDTLLNSFVTNINQCHVLNIEIVQKVKRVLSEINMNPTEYSKLEEMVNDVLGCFRIVEGSSTRFFHLRRTGKDVDCPICRTAHESENGYLQIGDDGLVTFHCYRDINKNPDSATAFEIGRIKVETKWIDRTNQALLESLSKVMLERPSRDKQIETNEDRSLSNQVYPREKQRYGQILSRPIETLE